jgi:hypothetical protein
MPSPNNGYAPMQFLAIVLTALALVPSGAHLFELPNKIGLPQEQYFTVQAIYRGWALFGGVIIAAIVVNLAVAFMLWRRGRRFLLSLAAAVILALTLVVFFVWTYPANQATDNWAAVAADWEKLRAQWELSHAANAFLTFIGFCCTTLSVVMSGDGSGATTAAVRTPLSRSRAS